MLCTSLRFELHKYYLMEEGAGGNCPPHFEKLRVAKLIPPHLALKLRERKKPEALKSLYRSPGNKKKPIGPM